MAEPYEIIFLAAGRGGRMGSLSLSRPKPLIPIIEDRGTLELNLATIAQLAERPRVTLVTGYRSEDFSLFCDRTDVTISVVYNQHWDKFGPILSVLLGLKSVQSGRSIVLANGDTVYDKSIFQKLLQVSDQGICLVGSATAEAEADDVIMEIQDNNIRTTMKRPAFAGSSAVVSAGIVGIKGDVARAQLLAEFEFLFELEKSSGKSSIWHSVFERLQAAGVPAHPILVDREVWSEFDLSTQIEDYRSRARRQRV